MLRVNSWEARRAQFPLNSWGTTLKFHLQHSFLPHHKKPWELQLLDLRFFFFFLQHSSEILHSISLLQIKISHHQMHTIIGAGCWPGVGNGAWAPTQMQQLTEHCDPQHHHPANPHHSSARICAADCVQLLHKILFSQALLCYRSWI